MMLMCKGIGLELVMQHLKSVENTGNVETHCSGVLCDPYGDMLPRFPEEEEKACWAWDNPTCSVCAAPVSREERNALLLLLTQHCQGAGGAWQSAARLAPRKEPVSFLVYIGQRVLCVLEWKVKRPCSWFRRLVSAFSLNVAWGSGFALFCPWVLEAIGTVFDLEEFRKTAQCSRSQS